MKKNTAIAFVTGLLVVSGAVPALAGDDMCNVPMDQWQPRENLQAKLEAEGWQVKKVTTDDGCYEVYAITKDGEHVEAYFNPESLEAVTPTED
ncbi:PepSY domain-containing protein [Thalassospira lucentensis]|uniref:PepSY domain-containing protein n=1 Tax=Thalassospira lucentensis TaxID=168935 RepID=UPI003D2F2851